MRVYTHLPHLIGSFVTSDDDADLLALHTAAAAGTHTDSDDEEMVAAALPRTPNVTPVTPPALRQTRGRADSEDTLPEPDAGLYVINLHCLHSHSFTCSFASACVAVYVGVCWCGI